jgi:hypothetical protein
MDQNTPHSKGATPLWVRSYDFPLEAVSAKPSQVNLQYLLIDTQRNWEEKALYRHFAVKMLTQIGVEKISQLKIDFDPSYTHVVVHAIRVFRGGEWLDRLESARYNVIQRETDLEQNIYNGELTLVYFLEDIRKGDIIEYSYSLKGSPPLFSSHYTDMIYMQRDFSVEKIVHRFLGHPDLSFLIKPVNTAIEPKICDLSTSLREWSWEASDTDPYSYETDQPIWHNPPAHIEMSQYSTWEEVAKKLYPLYTLPSDFSQSIPLEMQALVEKWKISTPETVNKALLALRFIQDQIRYLGIEEGMGAFQPTDPRLTFQRRFGDCKDKTFLLHALLQLMNIPSKPLLVHTYRGKMLPNALPTPLVFDHLVLQLEIDGMTYYVDPTFSLQGGSLQTNIFPAYEWGLLLSNDSKELISLPQLIFKNPTEIATCFTLESEDIAHLEIKSVFHDFSADRFRRSLEWNGLKNIEEKSLSAIQEVYGAATLDTPTEITDDRDNNIMTLVESYRIPTHTISDKKLMKVFSYTLRSYLDSQFNPERASPYQLCYPLWVKEHIHINNPFYDWKKFEENYTQEHESLLYTLSTRINKNKADFSLELKHLKDHIPQASLRDYWVLVNDIDHQAPYKVIITALPTSPKDRFSVLYIIPALIIWPLLCLLSRKKRPTQDLLSFQLGKFRKFSSILTILSAIFISDNLAAAAPVVLAITLLTMVACYHIVAQRSLKISWFLQAFLNLQACLLYYFIFSESGVPLSERILAFIVCSLYLGSSLFILKKVRFLLSEEKKSKLLAS